MATVQNLETGHTTRRKANRQTENAGKMLVCDEAGGSVEIVQQQQRR